MFRYAGYSTGVLAIMVCLTNSSSISVRAQNAPPNLMSPTGWYAYNRVRADKVIE